MIDYIDKLDKLFNQVSSAGEDQNEKDKLYDLLSHLPIQYHHSRTALSNSPDFENLAYNTVCDRLTLEHRQLIGDPGKPLSGTGLSTGPFFSGGGSYG